MSRSNLALSNLAIGVLSGIGILSATQMPFLPGISLTTSGALGIVGVIHRHRRNELKLADYSDGVSEFADDIELALKPVVNWFDGATEPVVQQYVIPKIPPIAQYLLDAASAERDDSWLTQKFIRASKFVLGGKGTGKSTWIRYEARRFVAENEGCTIRIVDLHRNDEDGEWLPGIPESDYLATTKDQALAFLREIYQVGHDRIASGRTDHPEYKLILDEWQGILDRCTEEEAEFAVKVVRFVQDELRKYRTNITITSKSFKKELMKLDSSVIGQMDLLALGKSLADPTNKLPMDIDAKALVQKRNTVAALPGCKYACVYRDAIEGEPEIKVIPDNLVDRMNAYQFSYSALPEHEQWLLDNRDRILELKEAGKTTRQISEELKVRRTAKDLRWSALKQFLATENEPETLTETEEEQAA